MSSSVVARAPGQSCGVRARGPGRWARSCGVHARGPGRWARTCGVHAGVPSVVRGPCLRGPCLRGARVRTRGRPAATRAYPGSSGGHACGVRVCGAQGPRVRCLLSGRAVLGVRACGVRTRQAFAHARFAHVCSAHSSAIKVCPRAHVWVHQLTKSCDLPLGYRVVGISTRRLGSGRCGGPGVWSSGRRAGGWSAHVRQTGCCRHSGNTHVQPASRFLPRLSEPVDPGQPGPIVWFSPVVRMILAACVGGSTT